MLQRIFTYFKSGATASYAFRHHQLLQLKKSLQKFEPQLLAALNADLAKPELEAYLSEIAVVYTEINYALANLKRWMAREKVATPLMLFHSRSYIYKVPLGVVLIIAPWNYPVQLSLVPLVGAIASGNCIVLKPSELMTVTTSVLKSIVNEAFIDDYIQVVEGEGAKVVPQLIEEYQFNHVFFTGSTVVGRKIAMQCATKLIPYTLELGGKSPAIIDKQVNLDIACKRLAWGKLFNAGQTCVAPDYILVDSNIKPEFITKLTYYLDKFLAQQSKEPSTGLGLDVSLLDEMQLNRLNEYLDGLNIIYGGGDNIHLKHKLTIIDEPPLTHPIMQHEIFGRVLPILTYTTTAQMYKIIDHNPNPLALYIFSDDQQFTEEVIARVPFGGGAVNTTLMHLANHHLPFGGVMTSGQGKYHGKYTFDTFSHLKSILKMSTWFDAFLKYPPYTKLKLFLLKLF